MQKAIMEKTRGAAREVKQEAMSCQLLLKKIFLDPQIIPPYTSCSDSSKGLETFRQWYFCAFWAAAVARWAARFG